jgi:holo-[acyl-carrier protein] synthase
MSKKINPQNEVIGIGIDILEVDRIEKIINKKGESFLNRIFTDTEIKYCKSKKRSFESFAVRFSAKEAFIKAIESDQNIAYKDIEVKNKKNKKPFIKLYGKAKEVAKEKNINEILISLSHERHYVVANIILKGRI